MIIIGVETERNYIVLTLNNARDTMKDIGEG